uniref:hypothetical protein n=1 Tax=uncultured Eubacterium sp. TaxID=165185 RepID=UPI002591F92C
EKGEYLSKDKEGKVVTSKEKVEIALGEFDKNTDGTYSLKFEDIEVGKYTVKETQANIEGYDIEYVEMDGKKVNASDDNSFTSTAVVTKDGKVIEIVDAYKVQTGDLEIKKTIDGENITEDDLENLKFTVQNEAGEYLYKEDGKVKTSKDKHEIALGEFDKNNDGTYSLKFEDIEVGKYTVKETQANIEGYDIEYVQMDGKKVNASEDNSFTSTAVVTKDGKVIEIVDAYKAQTGDLELTKTIDGKNVTEDDLENLKFTVQNEKGEYLSKDKDGKVVTSKDKVEIALGEFDKNNDGTYSLKFEDIEVGKYTVKETQANIEGYELEYVKMNGSEVSEGNDKAYTTNTVVTKDGKTVTIEDKYNKIVETGDLTLTKTIDGKNVTEDDLENLKFTVQNENGEYLYKDENGKVQTSKEKVEIKLGDFDKNNDGTYSLTFEDIEVGKYTVKETQANIEGYDIEYVEMDGKKVNASDDNSFTSTTVVTKDGKVIEIVDAYKVQTGDLEIKKTIDGENITEDDLENLKFTVQNEAGEYLYKEDGKVKTSKDKVEIKLGDFDKNTDGTYSLKFEDIEVGKYTVKETQANIEGYEIEYVQMDGKKVNASEDNSFTSTTVVTKDGEVIEIVDAYKAQTGDLELTKTIDGKNVTEDDLENLKFTVQNEKGEYLSKDKDGKVVTSKDKVEIALGEFDKNNDGTYSLKFEDIEVGKYTVKETQANIEGYDIEYVQMDGKKVNASEDNSFTSTAVVTKDGKVIEIVDAYKVQTGDLEIKKTIDGENITEDDLENLKFTVQNEAGEYLYKEDGKVKTSKDKHEIALGEFDKNNDGTYSLKFEDIEVGKYTVKETQANIEGYDIEYVQMDGKKVNASEDNSFTSTAVVTKDGKVIEIVDAYKVQTGDLEIKKTIDGENITEDDLENLKFTVQNEAGEYLYKEDGKVKTSKDKVEIKLGDFDKNTDGTYSLKFEDIEVGKYTVKETQANIEGYDIEYVQMDGKKVNASEDNSFTSTAVVTKDGKVLEIVDAYKVQTGDLEIKKTIDGENITEDDLENLKFTVQNEAGEYLYKEDGKVKTSKDKVEIALGQFDKNNDGTYSLKFEDIEVGKYTVKETQANIEGYELEYVKMNGQEVSEGTDKAYTSNTVVTKDGKTVTIEDKYNKIVETGDLTLTKTIDGKNVTEDDLENLKFTVQNEKGEYLSKDKEGKVVTSKEKVEIALGEFDKNTDGTYSLKFEDIEVGKYTVKETQANIEGYDIEYVEMDGKKVNASDDNSFTSTAVVTKDGKVIEIVDAYKVQTGDLEIKKTIDGENITEDDLENLKFTVQNEKGEYLSKDKEGKVVTSKEKVEIALGEFDKNTDGTYSLKFEDIEVGKYTVKETQANIEGYDIEYVEMDGKKVNASDDNSFTSTAVVTKDGKVIEIVDAYKVQTGDLEIKKTIDGENITEDDLENLKFTVQNEAGEYLYKEDGKVKTSKDKHEIALGEFDKNNDGTYSLKFEDIEVGKYTVKETQANIEGYDIEYVQMDGKKVNASEDNSFTSTAVVTKDGKVIEIVDAYKAQTGDLELTKTIDGKNVTEDDLENLKFTVQNEKGEYLSKDKDGKVVTSKDKVEIALGEFDKNNDGTYSLKFEDIEVGKYTVKETQANIEGYELEYVKMNGSEVSEGNDKAYTTNTVVTKDGKTVTIEDKYNKIVETGDLTLTKTIDGKNVTEDDLENLKFTVQNENGEYLYKDENGKVQTSKEKVEIKLGDFDKNNDGTYSLTFEDIEVGKYTVKETQANIEGYDIEYVEMDGKKVNASDDNSFTSTTVVTKDGKVIEIVDAYKVQTGDLEIKKTIDGENITEDDLENLKFTVQNEAGEYLYKEDGKVKTSKDKVEIKLGDFDKNTDGTYSLKFEDIEVGKYTVKETQANIEGYEIEYVQMDGKKVNASEDNSFTSTTVVTKDGEVIEIVDAYKAQTGDLELTKTIDGKNVTEDDLENLKFTVQNEKGEYLSKDKDGKVVTSKDKVEIALGEFDKNNDGTYSLKFEDIEVGKYTVKETQANIEGYDIEYVQMDGKKVNASEDNSFTSTAVVTKDGKVIEIVDAYKVQTGDLEIKKTIDGENITEDDLENLKFTVQNEAGEYLYKEDGKVKTSKDKHEIALGEFDKNNDGTYSLKFEDIEVGKYTVKETQANIEGYDIEYVQMDGKKVNASEDNSFTSTAVVTKDGKVIEIVDAYKVQTGDLEIKKTIDGENITEDDLENLKFTVQNEAGEYLYKEDGKVKTSKDKVEIKLGDFDKNTDGTYSLKFEDIEVGKYTVKETQANIEGYDIEYVQMDGKKVNASEDNSFTSTAVVTKDGKVIEIVDAYKVQTGDLEIKKTIDGENITEDDLKNLKFTVQNEAGEYLYKDSTGAVKTDKEKHEIALGEFDKNNDGTYSLKFEDIEVGKYTVKETQTNIEGYELEYVKMNGSEVSEGTDKAYTTNTVVTKDGKTVTIEDKYKEIVETGDLEIKKTIDGENIIEDDLENLKFTVQNEAGEYLYKEDGKVKTSKDKVEIKLGDFDKNTDGTYSLKFEDIEVGKYTVKETQANIEGYELEYVKMNGSEVSEGTDKAYTTNTVVTKDGKTVTIEDKYKEIVETGDLEIKKTIDGENITEDDLENLKFTVQNEKGEYLSKDKDGKVVTSKDKVEIALGEFDKNNDGTYSLKFEDIEVGKYTVKETQANIEGYDIEYVEMDGKKVNASNDDSFTTNAVVTKDGKVLEIVDAYKVQTGDLEIKKTLDGDNIVEDDFENLKFTVQNEAGEYLFKDANGNVKTSRDKHEIKLGDFDKNSNGTYTLKFENIEIGEYTVKETQANVEGYELEYVKMNGQKVSEGNDDSYTANTVLTKDGKTVEIEDKYKKVKEDVTEETESTTEETESTVDIETESTKETETTTKETIKETQDVVAEESRESEKKTDKESNKKDKKKDKKDNKKNKKNKDKKEIVRGEERESSSTERITETLTGETEGGSGSSTPQTGDFNHIKELFMLFLSSLVGLVAMVKIKKKNQY